MTSHCLLQIPLRLVSNDFYMALACTTLPTRTRPRSEHSCMCHMLQWETLLTWFLQWLGGWVHYVQLSIWKNIVLVLFLKLYLLSGNACISRPQIGFLYEPQTQHKLLPALRHLNHSLCKGGSHSHTVAWTCDYGRTSPVDSSVTWGLAQELKFLGCGIVLTHRLQSTEDNLGLTQRTGQEAITKKNLNYMNGFVHPGEEKAFQYLKGAFKKSEEGLLQGHVVTGQGAIKLKESLGRET